MKATFTIAWHEFLVTFRRRSVQVITALIPLGALVAILAFNLFQGREAAPKAERFGYVDGVGIFTAYRSQGNTEFIPYQTVESGMEALLQSQVRRLYVIPPDYLATGAVLRYGVGQVVDIFVDAGQRDPALRGFLLDNMLGPNLAAEVAARIKNPVNLATVTLDPQGKPRQIEAGRVIFFYILAALLVMSIFMSSGFLLQGIGEEKENRIMEVLLSSVSPGQLLVGKILGLGAAGLGQILIWLASGQIILKLLVSSSIPLSLSPPGALTLVAVVFFVLGYLLFATLMAGLGAISSTARESHQLSGIFVVPAIAPIYATPYIVSHPAGAIARFLTLFPLTSPIVVLQRLAIGAIGPWEVIASIAALTLGVAGALFLAIRVFRAYLLMYGKRPGVRDLWLTLVRG